MVIKEDDTLRLTTSQYLLLLCFGFIANVDVAPVEDDHTHLELNSGGQTYNPVTDKSEGLSARKRALCHVFRYGANNPLNINLDIHQLACANAHARPKHSVRTRVNETNAELRSIGPCLLSVFRTRYT